ncbi:hypothetical protein PVAP13_7KG268565 [Panicum virgatum]|uniref:Uncharacterized protein n=1 Tax=Panicum virgatum TaxID=38727 RepID=A0A8T0QFC9_PANVG|nr:hypothetical protein PVAP13_7KG268565 [Panicum virgatum]
MEVVFISRQYHFITDENPWRIPELSCLLNTDAKALGVPFAKTATLPREKCMNGGSPRRGPGMASSCRTVSLL